MCVALFQLTTHLTSLLRISTRISAFISRGRKHRHVSNSRAAVTAVQCAPLRLADRPFCPWGLMVTHAMRRRRQYRLPSKFVELVVLARLLVFVVVVGGRACLLQQQQQQQRRLQQQRYYRDGSFCMSRHDAAFFVTAVTGRAAAAAARRSAARRSATTPAVATRSHHQGFACYPSRWCSTAIASFNGEGGGTTSEQDTREEVRGHGGSTSSSRSSSSSSSSRGQESTHQDLWSSVAWEGEGEWNGAPTAPAAGGGSEEAMVGSPEFVSLVRAQFQLLATAVPDVNRVVLFVRRENTETGTAVGER